uniref:Uncharacterized protein n=1 Tax=Chromera velia CCMP2878 TaxID=1169474 RepID=A0A0G4HAL5_9ALVE|mmetsp:Transcript_29143/g.57133  ORF Transcript_29143/g.57133 Transcript_29143/m.57133 type:complete len:211 (+) Transcript_29143:113-745(+)|eukprot:Cvel_25559.t1-p1 / transcript=Cvel_25559.t1 / gene=Cvel_25559 / organism=Chromera_velia_CCMP2878 / gene_product=hypothetical protein / transcript_product=hypothetical protein / location=Cvel_scaffold2912:401-1514(-) / protein_length=210 / sequence_SO=supercontig / SO=protein_coding / is_pseudo=false
MWCCNTRVGSSLLAHEQSVAAQDSKEAQTAAQPNGLQSKMSQGLGDTVEKPQHPSLASSPSFSSKLQMWKSLDADSKLKVQQNLETMVMTFCREFTRGKTLTKLGKNGRMFRRLCLLDTNLTTFSMHISGAIIEMPLTEIQDIRFGYDLSSLDRLPVTLPSETLAAVVDLKQGGRQLQLLFSNSTERDEFVAAMLILCEQQSRRVARRGR